MVIDEKTKCIIWGAGYCGRIALEVYGRNRVISFADTYKAGKSYEGISVISYSQMCEEVHTDNGITVVIASEEHFKEMQQLLERDGISDYVLFFPYLTEKIIAAEKEKKDIFDKKLYSATSTKQHKDLEKFKDIHKGKRVFLVGNGPSLSAHDLDLIHENEDISFAFNKIYRIFDQTAWRPDYYGFTDFFSYKINMHAVDDIKADIFLWDVFEAFAEKKQRENVYFFNFIREPFYPNMPKFSSDIVSGTYLGNSVTYDIGLQFAAYMGFKEIYLVGMDHEYADEMTDSNSHFQGYFEEKEKNLKFPMYEKEKVELSFQAAGIYANQHDIKIYNATSGGKLEVFDRVDFDELF